MNFTQKKKDCLKIFIVFLISVITNGCPGCPKPKPLDLHIMSWDYNAYPLNPKWEDQIKQGAGSTVNIIACSPSGSAQDDPKNWSSCTNRKVTIERGNLCGPHVNWQNITYEGQIYWDSHSSDLEDDDYNVELKRTDKALYANNRDSIHSEFDSDETIDHFKTPWWNDFHDAVDNDNSKAHNQLDGKNAIVIGLLGLDCAGHEPGQNTCGVELHPVFVLAIHTNDNPLHDKWVFFARNRGDEGWCSTNKQTLESFSPSIGSGSDYLYSVVLPMPPNATNVEQINKNVKYYEDDNSSDAADRFETKFLPNKGLQMTFILPDPNTYVNDRGIEGEIEVQWAQK